MEVTPYIRNSKYQVQIILGAGPSENANVICPLEPGAVVQLCNQLIHSLCVLALICCYLVLFSLHSLLRQNAGNPILAVPKFFSCDDKSMKSMMLFHWCCHEHQTKSSGSHGLVVSAVTCRAKGYGFNSSSLQMFFSPRV